MVLGTAILADHGVDTSNLMRYVHYLKIFLKRSPNTGFRYREVHINVCSGYITCWHLGNVPDPKKVQFVRQITLGVNHSCPLISHVFNPSPTN